jgi:hypothetical protein
MTDTPRKKYVDPVKAGRLRMRETWGPEVARAVTVETQNWRAAHPPTKRTISFGFAVNKWLVKEAKRQKCSVAEAVRRIVHEKGDFF